MARVVERALNVTGRAAAHVATKRGGATARDPIRGPVDVQRQPAPLGVRLKVFLENPSERAFHHAYNAHSSIACTPPA
jgi:hypothetical protein